MLFLRAPWMGSLSGELLVCPGRYFEEIRAGRIGDFQPLFFSWANAIFSPKFPRAEPKPGCAYPECLLRTPRGRSSETNYSSPPPRCLPRPPLFVKIGRPLPSHTPVYGRFSRLRPCVARSAVLHLPVFIGSVCPFRCVSSGAPSSHYPPPTGVV